MIKSGIYMLLNTSNNKVYIGQSNNMVYRIRHHWSELRGNYHCNSHLQRAYNQNPEAFKAVIVARCPESELDRLERFYIKFYDSICNGYNFENGGKANKTMNEDSKKRMIAKVSGIKNHNFGKVYTEAEKQKLHDANVNHSNLEAAVNQFINGDLLCKSAKDNHITPRVLKAELAKRNIVRESYAIDRKLAHGSRQRNDIEPAIKAYCDGKSIKECSVLYHVWHHRLSAELKARNLFRKGGNTNV